MNDGPFLSEYVAESVAPAPEPAKIKLLPESRSESEPDARPFWGKRYDPIRELKSERAHHRIIILLKASGMSNIEIAEATGLCQVTVSNTLRQPWALQQVAEEIQRNGQDAIQQVLQGSALDSVAKLIELRDDAASPREVQRKCANDLLDRVFGKPNQPITHRSEDLEKLSDAELEKIARSGAN